METKKPRKNKGIWVRVQVPWSKTEVAVMVYFSKTKNKASTYREIARAYVSSSYSNYQKACNELVKRGYLVRLEDGKFKVRDTALDIIETGKESFNIELPYFSYYKNRARGR
jgi:hypothetical protein